MDGASQVLAEDRPTSTGAHTTYAAQLSLLVVSYTEREKSNRQIPARLLSKGIN